MPPSGFWVGPLYVRFYGILIMIGAVAACFLIRALARQRGEDPDIVWDMLPWLLIAGIIGARLWHILTPPKSMVEQGITTQYYLTHPLDAIAIWKGGLGIPGAIAGGLLALYFYTRNHHLDLLLWLDMIAPGVALGQVIGRWGNFFNQELYGQPSNLPWAIPIDPANRLPQYANVARYQPLFLYESLWNLLNMGVLLWVGNHFREWLRRGDLFLIYMIIYPVGRFGLEFLRLDYSPVAGLNVNQTLMAIIAVLATGVLVWRHRPGAKKEAPVQPQETAG